MLKFRNVGVLEQLKRMDVVSDRAEGPIRSWAKPVSHKGETLVSPFIPSDLCDALIDDRERFDRSDAHSAE